MSFIYNLEIGRGENFVDVFEWNNVSLLSTSCQVFSLVYSVMVIEFRVSPMRECIVSRKWGNSFGIGGYEQTHYSECNNFDFVKGGST